MNLPYGRKRALELATTLALEPELMLLDEPTQGMGHEDVHRVTELIKKVSAGRTILMVEHNMNVVSSIADRITVLQRGAVHRRRPVRRGLDEPAGDRGLHGHRRRRTAGSALHGRNALLRHRGPARLVRRVARAARRRHDGATRARWSALLGRNGAGRTTTMRAIVGPDRRAQGLDPINGEETIKLPPHRIAHLGVGYCPEERGIFASLSAEENLMLPPADRRRAA